MLVRLPLAAMLALPLVACDDEAAPPLNLGPTGPPSIVFAEPASAEPPGCLSIGDEVDARVPILVATEELVLRPPEACGQLVQCGHLALFTDGVFNNESATRSIELLTRRLGDPLHDGTPHAGTGEPDHLHLTVEVLDDRGAVRLDHEGEPVRDELDVLTIPSCCENHALTAVASQSETGDPALGLGPDNLNDRVTEEACKAQGCDLCEDYASVRNTTSPEGAWVQYEWTEPVTIGSMWIDGNDCSSGCLPGRTLTGGQVQYWDGSDWVVAQTFDSEGGDFAILVVPAITTTKVRLFDLTAGGCDQDHDSIIHEWYVYPGTGCAP